MPTVLSVGPYRLYFHSHEPNEPAHMHVDHGSLSAKFWLEPVVLARNLGYNATELRKVERIVAEHEAALLEAWYDFFDTQSR